MSTFREMGMAILEQSKMMVDDGDLSLELVIYLIRLVANDHIQKHVTKRPSSNAYLQYFPNIPVRYDESTKRKYSILPSFIMDLAYDGGIETVTYTSQFMEKCDEPLANQFNQTSPSRARIIQNHPYRKPTPKNPFFMLSQQMNGNNLENRMIYLGIECIDVPSVDMWLFVALDSSTPCNIDEPIGLLPEQEKAVYYEVMNLIRFGFLIPSDKINDGNDDRSISNSAAKSLSEGLRQPQTEQPQQPQ